MRALYSLLWLLLLPFAFLYLLWRARRQPEYLRHWKERLGFIRLEDPRPVLWVHAVSVGETRAAAPLVQALRHHHPDHVILLTHATPTGRATGQALFGDQVFQAYLPYDLPWLTSLFLARVRPVLGIFMETEIWPNLYATCRKQRIPIFLVNARLSERSARGYARFQALTRPALDCLTGISAQTEADAARLSALGGKNVQVTGNLKFDVTPPADTPQRAEALRQLFNGRFVVLAASTREGEEALILEALGQLDIPDMLLAIVPRHPQRFNEVAGMIRERDPAMVRRSEQRPIPPETRIFLGDSMGEMAAYYAACDLAFVGGSLLPLGGQNLIEAATAGRPVLVGPHTWNFKEAAEQAIAAGAALRVKDAKELAERVYWLREHPDEQVRMGAAGQAFAETHRGATARMMAQMTAALPPRATP